MLIHKVRVTLVSVNLPTRERGFDTWTTAERFAKDICSPNDNQMVSMDTHWNGVAEIIDEIRVQNKSDLRTVLTATIRPM